MSPTSWPKAFWGRIISTPTRACAWRVLPWGITPLGSDGPPVGYADIDLADFFFIIASNMVDCHPIVVRPLIRGKLQAPDDSKANTFHSRHSSQAVIVDKHLRIR